MIRPFRIDLLPRPKRRWGADSLHGTIRIGEFEETIVVPVGYWQLPDYHRQWRQALRRVLSGRSSALVTAMGDPAKSNFFGLWPMFPEGAQVVLQERLLFADQLRGRFDPAKVESYLLPHDPSADVSRWTTSRLSVGSFLSSLTTQR